MSPQPVATLKSVFNRGCPPAAWIAELVATLKVLPDEVFAPNAAADIYSAVAHVLGPYADLAHRRAVMAEVLRVLAGFESSWRWSCGRDTNNPTEDNPETESAGAWQVSYNSRGFGADLRELCNKNNVGDGVSFQAAMKENHPFAIEYVSRLLRHTINHNGPTKRHEIDPWLRPEAVAEFQQLLADDPPAVA